MKRLVMSAAAAALAFLPTATPVRQAAAAAAASTATAGPSTDAPEADAWLAAAWASYRKRFVSPEGRVVDDANGGVSHSEGQGYGMLLAALADDPDTFRLLWDWTSRELMLRPDGLASWRWDPRTPQHVTDPNNATDGDLLIAWALAEGGRRWENQDYLAAARRQALAIGQVAVVSSPLGPMLLPAAKGFAAGEQADGPVVNLSYWVFPAFEALATVAPEVGWLALRDSGLNLVDAARFGPLKLPTDWLSMKTGAPLPAASFKPRFGYDAIRIPLYIAWARIQSRKHLGPFLGLWSRNGDLGPFVIDVPTGMALDPLAGRGFKSVAALAECAGKDAKVPPRLTSEAADSYFPSTMLLLSTFVLRTRYPKCV